MVNDQMVNILMPVKNSPVTTEAAIRAVVAGGHTLTVYDDFSERETADMLDRLSSELHIEVIHLRDRCNTPSPNYRLVLKDAQRKALEQHQHLVIIESDVVVRPTTITRMTEAVQDGVGMVAAITHNEQGEVNFPYDYASRYTSDTPTRKRLSFCCTLLTLQLLQTLPFERLDPKKSWYDVFISHQSLRLGFKNILQVTNPVLHTPHSSRPWKQLKYTNPILYYWRKLIYIIRN